MKKVYFATTNPGKVNSLKERLSDFGIEVVHFPLELPEPRSYDLREIARGKVLAAYDKIGEPCVASDAGFYIHSLNGFPRTFTNFALETIGISGILKLVFGKPRGCAFRNCLAYMDNNLDELMCFESDVRGALTYVPRGEKKEGKQWSDLWLVFVPDGETKTLAEMTEREYAGFRVRHDKDSYAVKFAKWYSSR